MSNRIVWQGKGSSVGFPEDIKNLYKDKEIRLVRTETSFFLEAKGVDMVGGEGWFAPPDSYGVWWVIKQVLLNITADVPQGK